MPALEDPSDQNPLSHELLLSARSIEEEAKVESPKLHFPEMVEEEEEKEPPNLVLKSS